MKIQILVRLKAGVLDVQGKAVEHSIRSMGVEGLSHVRIGKLIEMEIKASSFESARTQAEQLCQQLLVNQIIETYEIRMA